MARRSKSVGSETEIRIKRGKKEAAVISARLPKRQRRIDERWPVHESHIVLRWLSDGPDKPLFVEIREAAEFSRFVNTVRLRGRLPPSAVRAGGNVLND